MARQEAEVMLESMHSLMLQFMLEVNCETRIVLGHASPCNICRVAEAPVLAHHAGVQGPAHHPYRRTSARAVFTRHSNDQTHFRSSHKWTPNSRSR
jgi:hypothetical protein